MLDSWNKDRMSLLYSITITSIAYLLSTYLELIRIGTSLVAIHALVNNFVFRFAEFLRIRMYDVMFRVILANIINFILMYMMLIIVRCFVGYVLSKRKSINLQTAVFDSKIGKIFHRYRLGYFMNFAFWYDIFQWLFLFFVFLKALHLDITETSLFESDMLTNALSRIIFRYGLIIVFIINLFSIFNPIDNHTTKTPPKKSVGLVINSLKIPQSTMSMPPNNRIDHRWFLLDEIEYEEIARKQAEFEISFVTVICGNVNDDRNKLKERYRRFYEIPHIGIILITTPDNPMQLESDLLFLKSQKSFYLNLSLCIIEQIDDFIGFPNRNIDFLKTIKNNEVMNYYYNLHSSPKIIYNYYRKILNVFSLHQAVYGFFDLIDLTLRCSVLSCEDLSEDNRTNVIRSMGSFSEMGKAILNSDLFSLSMSISNDYFCNKSKQLIEDKLQKKLPDYLDLNEILWLTSEMRNSTRAHGFIKSSELSTMYGLMLSLSLLIFMCLNISSMSITLDSKGNPILSFKQKLINGFKKYAFFESEKDLYVITNKEKQYINLVTGEMKTR